MADIKFKPFPIQKEILLDNSRIKCAFAGKRSGKSEVFTIEDIMKCEKQPGYIDNGIDPYMVAFVAPTSNMLRTLVWPKFRAFARPFEADFHKTDGIFTWSTNNTIIHGVSAEKIQRIEGKKFHHIHLIEAFQMGVDVFYECLARLADTKGTMNIDGSLGTNLPNPKAHWIYKTFIDKQFPDSRVWEWFTKDNPYFPKDELERFKGTLDPVTYRQLFELDWDTMPGNAVYSNFGDDNLISGYKYDPELETYIVIDWGFAHPAAVGFFQYDYSLDRVYQFDEVVESGLQLDSLYRKIKKKIDLYQMRVDEWICDIAGDQTREATGKSNIRHFKDSYGIHFKKRRTKVQYGIPILRSYVKSATGVVRYYLDKDKCPKTIDGLKRYHYKEINGIIQNENPVKLDDDCCDMARYFYINMLDPSRINKPPAATVFKTV